MTSPYKLGSVLLQYPTCALFQGLDQLDTATLSIGPKQAREALTRFLGWLRVTDPSEVAAHYVQTFDLRRRCALYLTYYRYGDTRKRGMAMVVFKAAYRDAGFVPSDDDLPDYLPMVLEFAARADLAAGRELLQAYRPSLELLRIALDEKQSPYAGALVAVCATLPGESPATRAAVQAMVDAGHPPVESVGLDAYDPRLLPLQPVGEQ